MNFMEKFNGFAERVLMPIANKVGNQRYIQAMKDGMVVAVPLSILGGVCLIIATPPFTPAQLPQEGFFRDILMLWYDWAKANAYALKLPFNMTMALMGLFIAFAISYNLAKRYKMNELHASIVSTSVFLLLSAPSMNMIPASLLTEGANLAELGTKAVGALPTNFLDAKGIFTAILISIGCVEIMRFLFEHNIRIKMPAGVPEAISASFDAIIPLFVCVFAFYGGSLIIQGLSGGQLLPSVIMTMLAPAMSGLDSLPGICFITIIAQVFWFFGLHGASITQFVRLPFMGVYIIENATAYANSEPLLHFFTQPFWSYVITLGGGGATFGLVILLTRSKSQQLKQLGRLSIVPACFNINEPIIFGLPMVLNPIMMIPFIFVPVINSIIAFTCMNIGIVGKGVIETPWTTPAPLGAALGTMDIRTGIMVIGLIALDIVLYYPFFKVMEKQKIAEEQSVVE